jgi:hypothetical protein
MPGTVHEFRGCGSRCSSESQTCVTKVMEP